MRYGAMNFPVRPILKALEVLSKDPDYLQMSRDKIVAMFAIFS